MTHSIHRYFHFIRISGILLALAPAGSAANIQSANCSNSAIQGAINTASDGDVILIPAGSCSWTGSVTVPNSKGITLRGAGASGTIITMNGNTLYLNTSSVRTPVRVTGIQFRHSDATRALQITGTARNWRIDNNIFDQANIRAAYSLRVGASDCNVDSFTYGVIDSNQFIRGNDGTFLFVEWPRGAADPVACGDHVWSLPAERGTAQAVYIEDNVFQSTGNRASQIIDSRWGAKYVLRYNTIHNPWISTHSGCTNGGRNPIWTEVYKNVFTDDSNRYGGSQIEMRSTSGVFWANRAASSLGSFRITVDHERSYRTDCSGPYGGIANGTQIFDRSSGSQALWPVLGQPGWGPPQLTDMRSALFAGVFAWENRIAAALVNLSIANNNGYTPTQLQFGRELFNSSNVRTGPLATRPNVCTVTSSSRDVYISTDENPQGATIYVCSGTGTSGTWLRHWEPYSYPHPLRGGPSSGPPLPPTGVTVRVQ